MNERTLIAYGLVVLLLAVLVSVVLHYRRERLRSRRDRNQRIRL